jgi:RNA polymerase sigma factor (sigma-70 family)
MDMSVQLCLAPPGQAVLLRDFLAANYDHLHRRLARHLGCADEARDGLHDAWLRLGEMEMRGAVQSPDAYVYRVACNAAMERLRASRPERYIADADASLALIADPSPGPERVAEARAELAAVERAMQRLPRRHRAVLVALRIDEEARSEVAARHGLSLRRVDTALRQALGSLSGARALVTAPS